MTDANVSVSFSASIADLVAGVGEAKEALQSFSAPFGEINGQLPRSRARRRRPSTRAACNPIATR